MHDAYVKGAPLPESIGARADLYAAVRQLRLDMQREVDAVQERETELADSIIRDLPKGDTGASGLFYRAQVISKKVPKVTDWNAFFGYVRAQDRFDLLTKRVADAAVLELFEAGSPPPGAEVLSIPRVSVTKIGGK